MTRIFSNGPDRDFVINPLTHLIAQSSRLHMVAPYFTQPDQLLEAAENGKTVELLVGLNPATSPHALRRLRGVTGIAIRYFTSRFHAKIYAFDEAALPGQAHDLAGVPGLPGGPAFGAPVGDRAFDADWLLEDLEKRGAEAVIPSRRNRTAPRDHDREMYGWRRPVDSFLAGTRELRAIATRYDRTAESFAAGLAPSLAWWPRHDCQRALTTPAGWLRKTAFASPEVPIRCALVVRERKSALRRRDQTRLA